MKNKLELLDTAQGWIAVYSGETGSGEMVVQEEAHNIQGDSDQKRIQNALVVWGASEDETEVTINQ
ncbi:hypothetical protein D6U78_09990 [Vibrio cholerae]|uniref:Uncharacterized protein n=1 Tax=Vibrio cholerae TaxID=666 RepID=A0ABD7SSZ8_VIBCL|nr:hypothetical protein [Vibrio cholerae]EGR4074164.1 hypothetical protein [Vibrio cholerae]MBY4642051.1 hypothetical protein [Vibrio cholerae]MCR9658323.1 hypothetical protein [Vibrio cholerae]MCR9689004.1 hypothetical protein [Vibrio cholerae]MCR9737512.1 hypothetical protein [Vibrio cholerae]